MSHGGKCFSGYAGPARGPPHDGSATVAGCSATSTKVQFLYRCSGVSIFGFWRRLEQFVSPLRGYSWIPALRLLGEFGGRGHWKKDAEPTRGAGAPGSAFLRGRGNERCFVGTLEDLANQNPSSPALLLRLAARSTESTGEKGAMISVCCWERFSAVVIPHRDSEKGTAI